MTSRGVGSGSGLGVEAGRDVGEGAGSDVGRRGEGVALGIPEGTEAMGGGLARGVETVVGVAVGSSLRVPAQPLAKTTRETIMAASARRTTIETRDSRVLVLPTPSPSSIRGCSRRKRTGAWDETEILRYGRDSLRMSVLHITFASWVATPMTPLGAGDELDAP